MTEQKDDLWARLCALPRPHKVVDFPRAAEGEPSIALGGKSIGQIAIWVLSQEEQEASAAAAHAKTRELLKKKSEANEIPPGVDVAKWAENLYNNIAADEVLFRACRKPGDLKTAFFPSTTELRRVLSVDEVGVLISMYYTVQEELGPIVSEMTDVECEAFLARIQKSGERFPLDFVSPALLKRLILFSVSQRSNSSTATSSPGAPPDESSNESKNVDETRKTDGGFDDSGGAPPES